MREKNRWLTNNYSTNREAFSLATEKEVLVVGESLNGGAVKKRLNKPDKRHNFGEGGDQEEGLLE